MKQSITVPNQVTSTFFNLPCVSSAHKRQDGSAYYILHPDLTANGDWCYANPGDILIEEDSGKWSVTSKTQIKTITTEL